MIFARWRIERRAKRERAALKAKYRPLIEAAKKAKDRNQLAEVDNNYYNDLLEIDEDHVFRTDHLVRRAHRLDIPVPPQYESGTEQFNEDDNWYFNQMTGNSTLTTKAWRELVEAIRKEEMARLEHQMRWVSHVIAPVLGLLIGLTGAIMGLISLIHSLYPKK